jgi:type II restriction enzyme
MFGYEDNDNGKKFMFSPLGNLFLKHINNEDKLVKIFISMMFAMQFEHPANGTSSEFQLYPFRLIFKLLTDDRLEGKLHHYEYAQILAFVKSVNDVEYENLVNQILVLRSKTNEEIKAVYKSDEHTYVNAVYEWEYYTCKLLDAIGIIDKTLGAEICSLYHPQKPTSHSAPTKRTARDGYITLKDNVIPFIRRMLDMYSYEQKPLKLDDSERLKIDVIKEIYSFYPQILMDEIGENDELTRLLELPKLIEAYSNNPENNSAYLFEEVLAEGFDMFYNVKTRRIGGAGHTDIECLYLTKRKKFAVESKSTANKLIGINAGRLREQREEIGGEYTIVITPRYVPAAKRDIKDAPIVIILANTFAEYLYNHIFNEIRKIDYEDFDSIIVNHLGEDVSKLISDMTMEKFAANG